MGPWYGPLIWNRYTTFIPIACHVPNNHGILEPPPIPPPSQTKPQEGSIQASLGLVPGKGWYKGGILQAYAIRVVLPGS